MLAGIALVKTPSVLLRISSTKTKCRCIRKQGHSGSNSIHFFFLLFTIIFKTFVYIFLQVGWNYVEFTHRIVKFHIPRDKSADDYRNLTLFRTKFVNSSDDKQRYTFRTERQTKSSCSLSVQKGYTLGASTNLEFALPTNAAPGVSLIVTVQLR